MSIFKSAALAAALALAAGSAGAATVVSDATGISGTFTSPDGAVYEPAHDGGWVANDSTATWIWVSGAGINTPVTILYQFTLAGYDAATAALSGLFSLDDIGSISLNGTEIFADNAPYDVGSNWGIVQDYGTTNSSLFLAGVNTLAFTITNTGGPGGIRATINVTAEPTSAVPVPAALPLLAGALGGLGAFGLRRKRAA
ncbi:MAG: hypothetical protein QM656_16390 [Paracoccaceae bacterium]